MNEISIPVNNEEVKGFLNLVNPEKLVIFAHGSGSSRLSKRNQFVASILNQANISTLLFDLLTPEEDKVDAYTREFRFDIELLADRLELVTEVIHKIEECEKINQNTKIGYFGASTGAAAALIAAAKLGDRISAVVSRGGRPDLAGDYLDKVKAPTLLIVGGLDLQVIELNKFAFEKVNCKKELDIIPGASHLFEEPGTLEIAAESSKSWFLEYL